MNKMRLLKEIIRKKLDLSNEFMHRRYYYRSIWNFYCAYNLCCSYLNYKEDEKYSLKRENLWRKFMKSFLTNRFDEKRYNKLKNFMQRDVKIIIIALNKLEEITEKTKGEMGDLYKPCTIGMLAYEFSQN